MSLPTRISQWWVYIQEAARTHDVDPYTLAAICDRETGGGTVKDLDELGAGGTGDFAPRKGHRYANRSDCKSVQLKDGSTAFVPADGRGWGRGLFQIDFGAHPDLVGQALPDGTPAWKDPLWNAKRAADILKECLKDLDGDDVAAIGAYNAGPGNVRHALAQVTDPATETARLRAVDSVTADGNYASDVLRRRSEFIRTDDAPYVA